MMMRIEEAAKFLGVSKHTLKDWKNKGKIPYLQPDGKGGVVLFNRDDLLKWIEANTQNKKKPL